MNIKISTHHDHESEPKKIFVTGGSGFLGQHIIRQLRKTQHPVVALARSGTAALAVKRVGAIVALGDINVPETLSFQGANVVVHAAAPVVFWGSWAMYEREIVHASLALYRRAAAQGVTRFIYISSESVLQNHESLLDIDELQPFANPPNSNYGRAKKAAEEALQAARQETPECELVILRPTFIWAVDAPAIQLIGAKVRSGSFAWIDGGHAPFEAVHVENVAQAVEQSITRGSSGSVFLITDGQPYTARSLLTPLIQRNTGGAAPSKSVPRWLIAPLAGLLESIWRTLRIWETPPPVSVFDVAFMSQPRRYRNAAARRILGYRPEIFPMS